jgi:uncharacterized protein YraI
VNLLKLMAATFISATMLWVGAEPAQAAAAVVTANNVQLRTGPGTSYRVVGRLRLRERVNVTRCIPSGRWCHVQPRGFRSGWVRARYLDPVRWGSPGRRGSICFHGSRGHACLNR